MSAGEEEEHGYETIIKAFMKALTHMKGSLPSGPTGEE